MQASPDDKAEAFVGALKQAAGDEGFDICRITHPHAIPQAPERLRAFLDNGYHGDMDWMARDPERRAQPAELWSQVRSVIVLGMNYAPAEDPLPDLQARDKGVISVYAQRRDYHDVIKKKLKNIARWMVSQSEADVKVFVDTAPVMEKPLAAAAGLGWQGKHTILCRVILVHGVSGQYFHHCRRACRRAGNRPLRRLSGVLDICPTGVSRTL